MVTAPAPAAVMMVAEARSPSSVVAARTRQKDAYNMVVAEPCGRHQRRCRTLGQIPVREWVLEQAAHRLVVAKLACQAERRHAALTAGGLELVLVCLQRRLEALPYGSSIGGVDRLDQRAQPERAGTTSGGTRTINMTVGWWRVSREAGNATTQRCGRRRRGSVHASGFGALFIEISLCVGQRIAGQLSNALLVGADDTRVLWLATRVASAGARAC